VNGSSIRNLAFTALLSFSPLIACADDSLYERDPVNYAKAVVSDPVAVLKRQMDAGKVKLAYDERHGYLPALLDALGVPAASQVLVFSKTSMQREFINPRRPRAIYFNDDVYVARVQGSDILEVTATDPVNGPMFYTVREKRVGGPAVVRQTDACLQCHASSMTHDLPGHIVRSVYPDGDGQPILSAGTFRTNPASPLKQRWGGWYVTGLSGGQKHMGNVTSANRDDPERTDFTAGTNLTDLSTKIDTGDLLAPTSDIVALMVMEHQAFVHNQVTRASMLSRLAMHDGREMNKALGRPIDFRSDSTESRLKNAVEPLVKAIVFGEETPLTERVSGTAEFAKGFVARGPRDAKGRSLRDFDLTTRMFRYPCSYLIYSPGVAALPAEAKEAFFKRLFAVLNGADQSKEFAHLSAEDRRAVLEILRGTMKDLPGYFRDGE
jgi:hypothetical protein